MKKVLKKFLSVLFVTGLFVTGSASALAATPAVLYIQANPSTINAGENSTITWNSSNATSCVGTNGGSTGWAGQRGFSGSFPVIGLMQTTTFTIHCVNSQGQQSDPASVTIIVNNNPPQTTVSLFASPNSIQAGGSSQLSWSVTGWTGNCTATAFPGTSQWSGSKPWNGGPVTVSPNQTTTYTLTCNGVSGSDTVEVTQAPPPPPPQIFVNLDANPTNIQAGGSSQLSWTVSGWSGNCTATAFPGTSQWSGFKPTSGFKTVTPTQTTTYTLNCGGVSDSATVSVTQTPPPQNPPTVDLTAQPMSIQQGQSSLLSWSVQNANPNSCFASGGWSGSKNSNGGAQSVSPVLTTTYILTCSNNGGSASDSVTVTVAQPQNPADVTLTANPNSVSYNGSTLLTWSVQNANSCVANSNPATSWTGNVSANGGSQTVSNLTSTTFFNIFCTGPGGSDSATVTVTVQAQSNPPTVDLTASQTNLSYGGATTLNWTSSNATSCYANSGINGWTGPKSVSGTFPTGNLYSTTTYSITCTGAGGTATDTVTVNVENQQNQQPSVTTYFASNIAQNSATLNGYLETYGQSTQRWFEWGTSTGSLYNQTTRQYQSYSGNFADSISGLQPRTTYYFRAAANGTYGNIYGSVATFTTTGDIQNSCGINLNCAPTAVTTIATNIDHNSARLNGLGLLNSSGNVTTNGYFRWGTTTALGRVTETKFIGSASSNPYLQSLFGLTPNTTYYFQAVVSNQYGTSNGEIQTFRTGTFTTSTTTTTRNTNIIYRDLIPVTNIVGTVAGVGVSKPSLVYLTVNHQNEALLRGSELEYVFFYKNVSAEQLRDLVLQITLPGELKFLATSHGYYNNETRTVVVNIPALQPQEEGSVAVRVAVDNTSEIGKVVAVTGNLAYTVVSSGSQEEVFAYSRNSIEGGQVLAGAVGFAGVLPGTLIGWVLLILVILLIVLLIRMLLAATERRSKDTQTSTTNTHTETHY